VEVSPVTLDHAPAPGAPLRLAEVLAPLTLATDLAMGAPDDEAMHACLVATALARRMGLDEPAVADVYYTTLLQHLGCTATSHEEAGHLAGDEIAARPYLFRTDFEDMREMLSLLASVGEGKGMFNRLRVVAGAVSGMRWGPGVEAAICEVAALMAERLGMSEAVQRSIGSLFERWDGKGGPAHLAGDAIPLPARIATVATRTLSYHHAGGAAAATERARASSGGWFDPAVAEAFARHAPDLLAQVGTGDTLQAVLDAEPQPHRRIPGGRVEHFAHAFADMADLKSPYTVGHSPRVSTLATAAADLCGVDEGGRETLNLAALLHDIGRTAVPAGIWAKSGPLTASERERVRLHPYYTERILARSAAFAPAASIAAMHHERLDGSGYPRGATAREIPMEARILAAADAYEAMTSARPHRPALSPEAAARALTDEARAGRLDPEAAAAVVTAAGQPPPRIDRELPAGLTERELDVLRLLARGSSNSEIAEALVISRRTAEHHVQHIYAKIGLSTRAGASMFAMEHDLLRP
jgi:HD-GYP domain-containing protein (c-di-GMP phosphodiesterase class II)